MAGGVAEEKKRLVGTSEGKRLGINICSVHLFSTSVQYRYQSPKASAVEVLLNPNCRLVLSFLWWDLGDTGLETLDWGGVLCCVGRGVFVDWLKKEFYFCDFWVLIIVVLGTL